MKILIFGIILIIISLWMAFEIWRAPELDENHMVIKEQKSLKDLLKKLKLWR